MFSVKVNQELKRKTNDELKKYKFIGAEIKSSRLKLSKTLDSICNVSKSISYISKIENNKIVPNQNSLMELCDELFITKEDLDNMGAFDECLIEALESIYKIDKDKMQELYNKYSLFTNVRTDLMKGLYYLMFKDEKSLSRVVENLKRIEGSLSLDDYLIYILLCTDELINSGDLVQALKVTKVILETENTKGVLSKIFKIYQFNIKLEMRICRFDSDYEELLQMHANSSNLIQINNTIKSYNELIIDLSSDSLSESFIDQLEFDDLKCYAYCKKNDLENAKKYFNENISNKYKMYFYYKHQMKKELADTLLKPLSNELLIVGTYFKLELEGNEGLVRNYISSILIPHFKNRANINVLLEYFNILSNINSKSAKYKETSVIGHEIINLVREVTAEITN